MDVKISSDSVARMAQPTCLVQMKVMNVFNLNFRPHHSKTNAREELGNIVIFFCILFNLLKKGLTEVVDR